MPSKATILLIGGGTYNPMLRMKQSPRHEPTEAEIRTLCLKIQESWSASERRRRAGAYAEAERVRIIEGIDDDDSWRFVEAAEA